MNKVIVIILLIFTVSLSEDIIEICELIHQKTSLIDSHNDGLPDTDTSENSEVDTNINTDYIVLKILVDEQDYKLNEYNKSFIEHFLEIPNPPPKES